MEALRWDIFLLLFSFFLLSLLLLFFTNPCVEVGGTIKLNFNLCPGSL